MPPSSKAGSKGNANAEITKLIDQIALEGASLRTEADGLAGGTKAAAGRLRKHAQNIKTLAQSIRVQALEARKAI